MDLSQRFYRSIFILAFTAHIFQCWIWQMCIWKQRVSNIQTRFVLNLLLYPNVEVLLGTGASKAVVKHRMMIDNSLIPGRPRCHFKTAIFNLLLLSGIFTSSKDNALRWVPWDLADDRSTLVQVMAWCRQATSHYLSQCWPRSMSPYDVTRPQWLHQFWSISYMCIDAFFLEAHLTKQLNQ